MNKRWLASVVAAFLFGVYFKALQQDSLQLVAVNAAVTAQEAANKREFDQAVVLDGWLAKHAQNERVIVREVVKLVDRPVYSNVCLDGDGLRLINAAKRGDAIQPTQGLPNP